MTTSQIADKSSIAVNLGGHQSNRGAKRGIRPSHVPHRRLYSATLGRQKPFRSFPPHGHEPSSPPDRWGRHSCLPRAGRNACPTLALLGLLLCACQSGCVERRMTVRSNPPGALLYVDDYEIGATPVSVNFTYYGTRKIRLVKDGYETLTVMQSIPPPWYEYRAVGLRDGELRSRQDPRPALFGLPTQASVGRSDGAVAFAGRRIAPRGSRHHARCWAAGGHRRPAARHRSRSDAPGGRRSAGSPLAALLTDSPSAAGRRCTAANRPCAPC